MEMTSSLNSAKDGETTELESPFEESSNDHDDESTNQHHLYHYRDLNLGGLLAAFVGCIVVLGSCWMVLLFSNNIWLLGDSFLYVCFGYFVLLGLVVPCIVFRLKDHKMRYRWCSGFFIVSILTKYKTALILPLFNEKSRLLIYPATALWECSNAALLFGGNELLIQYRISSYPRTIVACLAPCCQLKFLEELQENTGVCSRRNVQRSAHLTLYFIGGYIFRLLLLKSSGLTGFIESNYILEAEALSILTSVFVLLFDIPAHFWQLVMDFTFQVTQNPLCRVHTIFPYGSIYFSKSSREFWSKWSRPAMQIIRRMVYYPLLSINCRRWMAIIIMFFVNASSHYDVSFALVKDRAEIYWNLVFGTLLVAALVEIGIDMSAERRFAVTPLWITIFKIFISHISIRIAIYVLIHYCLDGSLSTMFLGVAVNNTEIT